LQFRFVVELSWGLPAGGAPLPLPPPPSPASAALKLSASNLRDRLRGCNRAEWSGVVRLAELRERRKQGRGQATRAQNKRCGVPSSSNRGGEKSPVPSEERLEEERISDSGTSLHTKRRASNVRAQFRALSRGLNDFGSGGAWEPQEPRGEPRYCQSKGRGKGHEMFRGTAGASSTAGGKRTCANKTPSTKNGRKQLRGLDQPQQTLKGLPRPLLVLVLSFRDRTNTKTIVKG